ncbi:polyadenylate-binding protein-interacting protein 1-like [Saccostrea cucullata]|uniref:polyadenylate-binding protein-interacting protein 1-like n=1 Tax=Saccostrea cuccullata TaxID=36930 RepID=UPI002ED38DF9
MSSEAGGKDKDSEVNGTPVNPAGLRKPHQSTQEKLRNELYSPKKPQSNLSVNAPEFVPRKTTFSVTAAEFVPRQQPYPQYSKNLYEDFQDLQIGEYYTPSREEVLNSFQETLTALISQPGNMEELMRVVIDQMKQLSESEQSIQDSVIEMLFEQCVTEPNFRYTGARLCKLLCKELKSHPIFKNFRGAFLTRCKLTGSTIEDTAYLNTTSEGSYDEVFLQIRQLDTYPDLNRTSKCLIKSVIDLKDNNWGRSRSSNPVTPEESYQPVYQQAAEFTQNEPVFYNQQGQPITAEEAGYYDQAYNSYLQEEEEYARWEAEGFEEQNAWVEGGDYQAWSSDPNQLEYDNGYYQTGPYSENYMDEEIEAAYEEFLRQQPPPPQ